LEYDSDVGSALFDAQCLVNLRDKNANPYYLTHQRATTGNEGFYAHDGPDGEYYALSNIHTTGRATSPISGDT